MKTTQRSEPTRTTYESAEREDQIRRRAYELYQARGFEDGHDLDDWLQAEAEIIGTRRRAIAAIN